MLQYGTMTLPHVVIEPRAAKRLLNHDCWVFRDELARSPDGSLTAGEVVQAVDPKGRFVAFAFYSPSSHIALRAVSASPDQPVDRALLAGRLSEAIALRGSITGTNAKRLVFSEADGLPGLIVDQYDAHLVIQLRNAGIDRFRSTVVELLQDLLHPAGILERSDKEFRDEEGLPPTVQVLAGQVPDRVRIVEDELQFWVDPHRGLKTGFYLDQRTTRRKLREWIQPGARVLDTFSYTGSLGLAAARRGARVIVVEQHEPFLQLAKENARLNGVEDRMEFVAGDAFYWLAAETQAQARYDWITLDPPALVKTRAELTKGRQALHHLVVNALDHLAPSGALLLSTCTYHLLNLTEEIVRIAAADRGMRMTVRDQWLQATDHPWILQIPATRYLTSWLFARDAGPAA